MCRYPSAASLLVAYGDCGSGCCDSLRGSSGFEPVDRGRRGEDHPPHAVSSGGQHHVDRAACVDLVRPTGFADRPRDGWQGRLVEHDAAAFHGRVQGSWIKDRALHERDPVHHPRKACAIAGYEVVKDCHLVAALDEASHQMVADKAGPAGHQRPHLIWPASSRLEATSDDPDIRYRPVEAGRARADLSKGGSGSGALLRIDH